MRTRAFLGLGANLGDPVRQIGEALRRIGSAEGTALLRQASMYRSKPVGPPDQPDYANTVAEVETSLDPEALLELAKRVEAELGRVPTVRWGPRRVDVDLLLYGDGTYESPRLVVPHRELCRRRFVLAPLCELAPDMVVPGTGKPVRAHLAELEDDPRGVWREA